MLFALAVVPFFLFGLFSWLCAIYANSKRKWNTHKLAQSKASITQATKSMNMKNKDKTCTTLALCMCRGTKKQSINESMLNEARKKTKNIHPNKLFLSIPMFLLETSSRIFLEVFFPSKAQWWELFRNRIEGKWEQDTFIPHFHISDHIYYSLLDLFLKLRY